MNSKTRLRHYLIILFIAISVLISACSGGDGGTDDDDNGGGGGTTTGDDVVDTLTNLNVDTSATDRVDENNEPIPSSFTPVGKNKTLSKKSEIFLAGLGLTSEADHVNLLKFKPGVSNVPAVPDTADSTEKLPPDELDTSWKNDRYNASTAGDIDGDGFEEIILLWWDSADNGIRLKIIDDEQASFAESPVSTLTTATPSWLQVVTGDFNGDATSDIAIAIVDDSAGEITLSFLTGNQTTGYSIDVSLDKTYVANEVGSELGIEFAVGQIDWDSGEELGVVINEIWGNGRNRSPGFGTSYYHLYDDHSGGYAELKTGRIAADIATATHNAVVGSIAMGDVDGDGMDEIVLAGLADTFPIACDSPDSIAFVIDDASNNFADLGASFLDEQSISGCEPSANNSHIEHVWVDTLDIDGDQYAEIQVNGVVYEDFKNTTAPWDPMMVDTGQGDFKIAKIPYKYIYVAETRSGQNDRSNTVLTVGDVTADGKQDILVYSPRQVKVGSVTNGNVTYDVKGWAVTIWGINPEEKAFEMQYLEELEASDSGTAAGGPPQIVAVNVDADSTILQFSEGSHKLVFSEPIVLAALAAPPCRDDGGQITDACTTAWGKGESTGSDTSSSHELSVTYFAGANLGTDVPWVGKVGVELKVSAGVSLQSESSRGYELSKTITYIAGAMEDTVIATVVPYDQYTYKIISHPVFPEAEGEDYVISLPRSPRTMQINRTFYNDSLVGDGIRIDDRVFNHIIGDVDSYPSKSDMLAKAGSVAIGPVDVGASSGSTSVEISENIVSGFTQSISVSAEVEVNVSAGQVFGGYTIGATAENSLSFSTGDSVVFSGTVGEMPPATFTLDKAYSYGMFVYTQRAGSVQTAPFQVINYWVE